MATIQDRPFSKEYSGLVNQSVIAVCIIVLAVASHEFMTRKRRGKHREERLGSVESWQFGYLYQGRSWAKKPSPPYPRGWPLSWVPEVLKFPEEKLNELRGVDAALYCRFVRGCWWFVLLHTLTTMPILLPIHIKFSPSWVDEASMTRASISSLVQTGTGLSLLWIHICLLFWVTLTWMITLYWISTGAFRFRASNIEAAAIRAASDAKAEKDSQYYPHPHPQYPFYALPALDHEGWNRGLRLRTVMVTNLPPQLRSEKELKEYFEYYLSRPVDKPSMGVTAFTHPGFFNKMAAFLFNRAKQIPSKLPTTLVPRPGSAQDSTEDAPSDQSGEEGNAGATTTTTDAPVIDRVVIARKMTELSSLLERREDVLKRLEAAHIKLARKALCAVKGALEAKEESKDGNRLTKIFSDKLTASPDVERGEEGQLGTLEGEDRTDLLVRTLGPFVAEFGLCKAPSKGKNRSDDPPAEFNCGVETEGPRRGETIWDALLSLPRSTLDAYQPLIHLSHLFRGKTVPAIDYYTAKLGLLTSLITENRARAVTDYDPVSTAFVTFANPNDARRACKFLAVHPNNPLTCLVTMAPSYEDLDWNRVMKSTFRVEFLKDWVVDIGVWAFTLFWLIPVSLFVTLVSIQNISAFWPGLKNYLDHHPWEEELIQSFLPTLLVALLAITVPLLLLLIAKKAHTISTLSSLHDRIMTRYYKFLIVNVLVFFCVGTAALQSFLINFRATTNGLLNVVAVSFPSAGPFYVGWLIFTAAMHGGFELALFGLPLIMYPSTKRQITPRKRAVGIRPRTFNYYYWLPNHMLVIHVLLLFSVLNPLVIPFGFFYFCVERVVIKNQLLHVYAKNYEGNGKLMLIRIIRYSLDGLVLSQAVFLAYMVVLKKTTNIALSAVLIVLTAIVKLVWTRVVRVKFDHDDIREANIICGTEAPPTQIVTEVEDTDGRPSSDHASEICDEASRPRPVQSWSWRMPTRLNFTYSTMPTRPRRAPRHHPIPFGLDHQPFTRLRSFDIPPQKQDIYNNATAERGTVSMPSLDMSVSPLDAHIEESAHEFGDHIPPLVTPHASHPRWDDESDPDHPYDNPYYTRTVSNVLWLPRDPVGLLDLDDTVDVRRALTSEPGADQLGEWPAEQFSSVASVLSGLQLSTISSFGGLEDEQHSLATVRRVSGSESIALPPVIAARVQSIEKEDDVEVAPEGRPVSTRRRTSSSGLAPSITSRRVSLGLGRPSTLEPRSGLRSFSSGSGLGRKRRTSSLLSTVDPRRPGRAASTSSVAGVRPDFHAQAEFAKSTLSIINPSSATLPRDSGAAHSAISTQHAVFHEVIKEEQVAAEERLEQEQREVDAIPQGGRSWWTAWMFKRAQ